VIPDLQELTESFTERTPNFITTIDLSQGFFIDFALFVTKTTGLVIGKSSLGSTVQIIPWLRSSSRITSPVVLVTKRAKSI
jgi:hypothetical protein